MSEAPLGRVLILPGMVGALGLLGACAEPSEGLTFANQEPGIVCAYTQADHGRVMFSVDEVTNVTDHPIVVDGVTLSDANNLRLERWFLEPTVLTPHSRTGTDPTWTSSFADTVVPPESTPMSVEPGGAAHVTLWLQVEEPTDLAYADHVVIEFASQDRDRATVDGVTGIEVATEGYSDC